MTPETKVTGVILAGGLARRMNNQDKGLLLFQGRPLVSYGIAAMLKVTDETIINANRNKKKYQTFGLKVVPDQNRNFDGPLAGILAAMTHAKEGLLLVMPCDAPFFGANELQTLLDLQRREQAEIVVASEACRLHPVFCCIKVSLKDNLASYLAGGHRKVEDWITSCCSVKAIFDQPRVFINLNNMNELSQSSP